MMRDVSRLLLVSLILLAVLSLAALLVWVFNLPYWVFPLLVLLPAVLFYLLVKGGKRIPSIVKWIFAKTERLNIANRCKRRWNAYLDYRFYSRQFEKIKHHLRKPETALCYRDLYVILANKDSGVSALLKDNARLIYSGPDSTAKNVCLDYWSTGKGIYLETRYIEHANNAIPKINWDALCRAMNGYFSTKLPRGIILCVDADALKPDNTQALTAKDLKVEVGRLQISTNRVIPIHVIVTKCDSIDGLPEFLRDTHISDPGSAVGYCAEYAGATQELSDFIQKCFDAVYRTFHRLRLSLPLSDDALGKVSAENFVPEALIAYQQSLYHWVVSVLPDNVPVSGMQLRSVHFVAAHSQAVNTSPGDSVLGLIKLPATKVTGAQKFYFARDLFFRIIPDVAVLPRVRLKLPAWPERILGLKIYLPLITSVVMLTLLLTVFANSMSEIANLKRVGTKKIHFGSELHERVRGLDEFGGYIDNFEQVRQRRWLPDFGFDQPMSMLSILKQRYISLMNEALITDAEKYLDRSVELMAEAPAPALVSQHINFLRHRIGALQQKLNPAGYDTFPVQPQEFNLLMVRGRQYSEPGFNDAIARNYQRYLAWQPDRRRLIEMAQRDVQRLRALVLNKDANMDWVALGLESAQFVSAYSLSGLAGEFAVIPEDVEFTLAPAYTKAGRDSVLSILDLLDTDYSISVGSSDVRLASFMGNNTGSTKNLPGDIETVSLTKSKNALINRFTEDYIAAWKHYLQRYTTGFAIYSIDDAAKYMQLVANGKSPYESLLRQAAQDLLPIRDSMVVNGGGVPAWVTDFITLGNIVTKASMSTGRASSKLLNELVDGSISAAHSVRALIQDPDLKMADSATLQLFKDYGMYQKLLTTIIDKSRQPDQAYQLLVDNLAAQSKINNAEPITALSKILRSFSSAHLKDREHLAAQLLRAQAIDVIRFAVIQAAEYVQQRWSPIFEAHRSIDQKQRVDDLQNKEHGFWRHYSEVSEALLQRLPNGEFVSRPILGQKIEFNARYLAALRTMGRIFELKSHVIQVSIEALPSGITPRKARQPSATRLNMECGEQSVSIVNRNFPITKIIKIDPLECDSISIEVEIGNITLLKKYSGEWCFFNFQRDFGSGKKVFKSREFTANGSKVKDIGVRDVNIGFRLKAGKALNVLAGMRHIRLPGKIVGLQYSLNK